MLISNHFRPDSIAKNVCQIDFADFFARGFKLVLLDLDNTLSPHGSSHPDEFAIEAVRLIRASGLMPALATNARKARANSFAAALGIPVVSLAGKPFVRKIKDLIKRLGFTPAQTILIGDQVFTDVLAARRGGVYAVLVQPRFMDEAFNIHLKRWLERPFLRGLHFPD